VVVSGGLVVWCGVVWCGVGETEASQTAQRSGETRESGNQGQAGEVEERWTERQRFRATALSTDAFPRGLRLLMV
jgi:hypothetical protein